MKRSVNLSTGSLEKLMGSDTMSNILQNLSALWNRASVKFDVLLLMSFIEMMRYVSVQKQRQ
jgi:hypothetical protein